MASISVLENRLAKLESANRTASEQAQTIIIRFVVSPEGQDQGECIGFTLGRTGRLIARDPGEPDKALEDRATAIAKREALPRCVAVLYEERKYREAA
jgi:hypothetical protein